MHLRYDFALFGFLAPELSQLFFPPMDSAVALMHTFLVFGGAFVVRPVGGVVMGMYSDMYVYAPLPYHNAPRHHLIRRKGAQTPSLAHCPCSVTTVLPPHPPPLSTRQPANPPSYHPTSVYCC